MRFPKTVRFRKAEVKIYGKSKSCPRYPACAYVASKRVMSKLPNYSQAGEAAEKLVREIAEGNHTASLSAAQAADALAAFNRLQSFHQSTGRSVSVLAAVAAFAEASAKLNGHALSEAVDGFLRSVASVKRMDIAQAMAEFIETRKGRTVSAKDGRRPRLSPEYHTLTKIWLNELAGTFPGYAVYGRNPALTLVLFYTSDIRHDCLLRHHPSAVLLFPIPVAGMG